MDAKLTAPTGARVITVALPHQTFNLEQVHKITANLMKQLGHLTCFSGFDIRFMHDDDYRVSASGEVHAVHAGAVNAPALHAAAQNE
jgi:hypothetical protein